MKTIIKEFREKFVSQWTDTGGDYINPSAAEDLQLWLTEVIERTREEAEQELRKKIHKGTIQLTYSFLEQDPELWKHKIEDNLNLVASIGFQKGKELERNRILEVIEEMKKKCFMPTSSKCDSDVVLCNACYFNQLLNDTKKKINF